MQQESSYRDDKSKQKMLNTSDKQISPFSKLQQLNKSIKTKLNQTKNNNLKNENDFKLNVLGAIKSIQAYTQNLLSSKQASIVLFSTVAVQTGMPFHSSVSISKGAIEGLTKALAAEFSPKIRVNCVAPSLTSTAMANKLINTPEKLEASNNRHPLKRIGNPEDIANTVEFLLSPHSSWITGQIIHVDG